MPNTPSSSSSSAASSASPASPTYTQTPGDDLRKHPTIVNPLSGSVTIGDLHGNTVLMLYFLIKSGVLELKDPAADYDKFVKAHKSLFDVLVRDPSEDFLWDKWRATHLSATTTMEDLREFWKTALPETFQPYLIGRLTINPHKPDPKREKRVNDRKTDIQKALDDIRKIITAAKVTDKQCIVRFIGDMLSDRGPCDYPTLLLLKKLQENKKNINVHILLSNHDQRFLVRYPFATDSKFIFQEELDMVTLGPQVSLQTMIGLINLGILDPKEINDIVKQYYLPNLMLIDISKNKHIVTDRVASGEATALTKFYTHAPTGPNDIRLLALALIGEPGFKTVYDLQVTAQGLGTAAAKAKKNLVSAQTETEKAKQACTDAEEEFTQAFAKADAAFRSFADEINKKYQALFDAKELTSNQEKAVRAFVWTRTRDNPESYSKKNLVVCNFHGHDGILDFALGNLNGKMGKVDLLETITPPKTSYWDEGGPSSKIHATESGLLVETAAAAVSSSSSFFPSVKQVTSSEDLTQEEVDPQKKIVAEFVNDFRAELIVRKIAVLEYSSDVTHYSELLLKIPERPAGEEAEKALAEIIKCANTENKEDLVTQLTRSVLKKMIGSDLTLEKPITKEQIIKDYCHPQEAIAAHAKRD